MTTVQPPSPPYVGPAPHQGGATNRPIRLVVIHCTAGAEPGVDGAAQSTVEFTKRSGVVSSYHYVRDAKTALQLVWDGEVAYHCGHNGNSIGYELCCSLANEGGLVVRAKTGAKALTHWQTRSHRRMLRGAAEDVARLCLVNGIPIRWLTVAQVRAGQKGLCGHVDIRDAFPGSTTHWDPGPFFPRRRFVRMVRRAARALTVEEPPAPPPVVEPADQPDAPAAPKAWLCLAGDWNEGPNSTGRYTPAWIAAQGGLTTPPDWRGIDYPMTSATLSDVRRIPGSRALDQSDHAMVAFDVTNPVTGRVLHCATWNVERDRRGNRRIGLLAFLRDTLAAEELDVVALQEVRQYHDLLGGLAGYRLVAATSPEGVEHNALLVRDGLKVGAVRFRLTSKIGWVTVTGGNHDPSSVVLATVDGWLRVGSVHEAPAVNWASGQPVGPVQRVLVRVASARTLARIGRHWRALR